MRLHGDALALRHYRRLQPQRLGALDLHTHAHWSPATHGNVGTALAWVASDAVEWHASMRWLPTLGRHQTLVGTSWTGGPDLTALAEVWHGGQAASPGSTTPGNSPPTCAGNQPTAGGSRASA